MLTACLSLVAMAIVAAGIVACSAQPAAEQSSGSSASSVAVASSGEAVELKIFAANSLSEALTELQGIYTKKNPNVTFSSTQFRSSGELNTMLENGAYCDIEITASKDTMDAAVDKGFVDKSTRRYMLKDDLVVVTAEKSPITNVTLDDVATGKYTICVGDDSVPAGNYANQSLSTVGCFNDPEGNVGPESAGRSNGTDAYAGTPIEGKVLVDSSVGNVCKHAETGDADIAVVYSSDVERFGGVKIVGAFPESTHQIIRFPGAVCSQSKHTDAAEAFLEWCVTDPEAIATWQEWGFEVDGSKFAN